MTVRQLVMIFACSGAALAVAQGVASAPLVSEKDFFGDMPIVLSVARLPQRLDETPGSVTILDRRTIRMTGARDVADLLRLVPGFRVGNSFEGNAPQGSYHGNWGDYANHVQVLVDGRSVYSTYLQGSTGPGLQTVALEDIERIEVLRGSNSAAYGARAFLGTINIVTRDTLDTLGLQAGVSSGDNGIRDTLVRLGWGDDAARFRISADRRTDNGLSGAGGPDRIGRVNLRADLRPSSSDQVELRAGQMTMDAEVGFADQVGNAPRTRVIDSSYLQLDWRRNLGPDQDLSVQASRSLELNRDNFAYAAIPGLNVDFGGYSTSSSLTLQHTVRRSSDLRWVWGAELRSESIISQPVFNTDAAFTTDFSRVFGNAQWHVTPNWVVNAGGTVERSSLSGDHFSPRLMLNWHMLEGQTLRVGASRAYRPPSTFEKYGNVRYYLGGTLLNTTTVARGNVQSEGILAREIGYLGDFPKLGLNLDVRLFHEEIRDFIRTTAYSLPNAGIFNTSSRAVDFINSDNFDIRGVEYQIKWRPWQGGNLVFSQSHVDSGWTDNGNFKAQAFSSASLMFTQSFPAGVDLSLLYYRADGSNFAGTAQPLAPAMNRTDLRLAWPLRIGSQRGEVAFVVQNMGPAYQDFLPDFYFRRQAFVMLRLDN